MTSILFLVAFAPRIVRADGLVRSDFIFQASDAIFAAPEFDFAALLTGTQSFDLPDSSATADDVPVNVRGARVSVDYQFQTPATSVVLGAEFPLRSQKLSARIEIARLDVDAVVSRRIGDVKVNVHVRGACEKIPVVLTGEASVLAAIRFGVDASGLPVMQMPWVEARWPAGSWSVGEFRCSEGGAGFGEQVRAGILSYLEQPSTQENVGRQLRDVVSERLGLYEEQARQWFLKPRSLATGIEGLSVVLNPQKIVAVKGEVFQIAGYLDFVFANDKIAANARAGAGAAPGVIDGTEYALLLPESLPGMISDMAYRAGYYVFRKSSRDIPAFLSLLDSTVAKLLAWPQLLFYSSASPFFFDFSANARPTVGPLTRAADGAVVAAFGGGLDVLVWAPTVEAPRGSNEFVKMIRFSSTANGGLRLAFEPREDGANLRIVFSAPAISLSADWQNDYRPYLWYPRVGLEAIKSKLAAALAGDSVRVFVPKLPMTSALALQARGLGLHGRWLRIDLK